MSVSERGIGRSPGLDDVAHVGDVADMDDRAGQAPCTAMGRQTLHVEFSHVVIGHDRCVQAPSPRRGYDEEI
jgi:hypothetical protein